MRQPSRRFPSHVCRLLVVALAVPALGHGCKSGGASDPQHRPAHRPVMELLMPSDTKEARITIERRKTRTGKTTRMLPRNLVASRSRSGVIYRFRERVNPKQWRLAAQLFIDAREDGAWLRAQHSVRGRRVGAKRDRLLFPWPPKPGQPHKVSYDILDGRKATATVTVNRYGFAREVAGKEYKPCLEVTEALTFRRGGGHKMRTVFCKGFGRVELQIHKDSLSKGQTELLDRSTKIE